MKVVRFTVLLAILLLISSCAVLTGRMDPVERDEFLYKLPMLNEQILGALKSDDPDLDLRTLPIRDYSEFFDRIELTSDDQKVVAFVRKNIPEQKYHLQQNTFFVCLRSASRQFILCDDAATPGGDRIVVEEPVPSLESFYLEFLQNWEQ